MSEVGYLVAVAVVFFICGWLCGDAPARAENAEARRRDKRDRMVIDLTQRIERKRDRRPW